MSQLYVDNIRNRTGGPIGIPTGAVVTGVLTATTLKIVGGGLTVTGVSTFSNDVTTGTGSTVGFGSTAFFRDDAKAIFGDGEDLEIYHNGDNSVIQNVGVGTLYIDSAADVVISEDNVTNRRARFIQDGAVELYHDGSKKFETTTNGVLVSDGQVVFKSMTTTDRNALSAQTGGVIYNSSTNKLQVYNGSTWVDLH